MNEQNVEKNRQEDDIYIYIYIYKDLQKFERIKRQKSTNKQNENKKIKM